MYGSFPAGRYRHMAIEYHSTIPWYIIPFEIKGRCEAPTTRAYLLDNELPTGKYSDIFLFSHGWNNDWEAATTRYEHFINGFQKLRQELNLSVTAGYKPLLVGVIWPSTALVTELEEPPKFAGDADKHEMDQAVAHERQAVSELAMDISAEHVDHFYDLIERPELDEPAARELANIVHGIYTTDRDEVFGSSPNVDEIIQSWPRKTTKIPFGKIGAVSAAGVGPQAAGGFLDKVLQFDPRDLVRSFTVWQMKDRAGVVGGNGVSKLLQSMLACVAGLKPKSRIHLIGHSYGCKVVLSALCHPNKLEQNVASVLLLQPAVSHLCFAAQVSTTNKPGGYHEALNRVLMPILSTFSSHDFALTTLFHRALWRDRDLGEAKIAASEPPSIYAALGGYGPRSAGEKIIDIRQPKNAYPLDSGLRLFGVDGSETISGHGDISNRSTWWALYELVSRSAAKWPTS